MRHSGTGKRIRTAVAAAAVLAVSMAFSAEETVTRSFPAEPGGRLVVDVDMGRVELISHPGNEVRIDAEFSREGWSRSRIKRFIEDFGLEFSHSGGTVTVRSDYGRGNGRSWFSSEKHPNVRIRILVPTVFDAELRTSGGSITVGDLQGRVDAKTSGGGLEFGSIRGTVNGRTSGGSVTVGDCSGDVDVQTSGGGIRVGRTEGNVRVRTSGGSITLESVSGDVTAKTSGGSIHAVLTKNPTADCFFETSGGGITVAAPEGLKADIDARTSGGRVSTDFPVTVSGEIDPHRLSARINGGGPQMILRTSGGGIRLEKSH
ncbi:DUF4097 family beta strand repeat protein [bacterium]|nr:DUF4097 family beta strand repeat protein [bacterium]